jgi:hypothetical protein
MLHISEDNLQRYLVGTLGSTRSKLADYHLSGCLQCASRLRDATRLVCNGQSVAGRIEDLPPAERRRDKRFAADEPVIIQVVNPFESEHVAARIKDVSRTGVMLELPASIFAGSLIKIHIGKLIAFGEVRYCGRAGSQFRAGVILHDVIDVLEIRHVENAMA